jgi:hypothetical protein
MKLNLGCGHNQRKGWINVDRSAACHPDQVVDLESFPWPFDDSAAEEVLLSHVLEHLGADVATFFGVIKELHRVCAQGAMVTVLVPHPRHDEFLADPTHVRPILPQTLQMFSKEKNREWIASGASNSPLGLTLDVDFELVKVHMDLDAVWLDKHRRGDINDAGLHDVIAAQCNVVKQMEIRLKVIKP